MAGRWHEGPSSSSDDETGVYPRAHASIHVRTAAEELQYQHVMAQQRETRNRERARATAGQLMARAGVPVLKDFHGKAHKLLDDVPAVAVPVPKQGASSSSSGHGLEIS